MNLSFLDDLFKGIGNVGADADQFMKREMPFDSGWGAPAALVATYFGAPYAMEAFGSTGSTAGGSGGMNSLLSNLGLDAGSFAGQEAFQLPMSSYTPEYLNMLAQSQGVDAGNASYLDRLLGNTEQGLYKKESALNKQPGMSVANMLQNQAKQRALGQVTQTGSNMLQQGQQSPQTQVPQAMMRKGQGIDTTSALLSLLQEKQMLRQPRLSLI